MVEGQSDRVLVEGLIERLSAGIALRVIEFEGRQDLERKLARRLRGYRNPEARFLILVDQDRDDCHALKKRLSNICHSVGRPSVVVRIACRQLENWYLGDLAAVGRAYGAPMLSASQSKQRYRTPDDIHNPIDELGRMTRRHFQKIDGARRLAGELSLDANRSVSFNHFIASLRQQLDEAPPC